MMDWFVDVLKLGHVRPYTISCPYKRYFSESITAAVAVDFFARIQMVRQFLDHGGSTDLVIPALLHDEILQTLELQVVAPLRREM